MKVRKIEDAIDYKIFYSQLLYFMKKNNFPKEHISSIWRRLDELYRLTPDLNKLFESKQPVKYDNDTTKNKEAARTSQADSGLQVQAE